MIKAKYRVMEGVILEAKKLRDIMLVSIDCEIVTYTFHWWFLKSHLLNLKDSLYFVIT